MGTRGIGLESSDTEANKAVVQRYVDEIQNGHSLEAIAEVFAEDFIDHTASGGGAFVGGIEGLKQGYAFFLEAFPDLHADVEKLISEGDTVVAYKTLTATHSGEWLGFPASGNRVEFKIISIYKIKDGRLAEFWGLQDETALRKQLIAHQAN
ncbi:SnoaL-like polyketide cyclase [Roseovarius albus]|uniref:SnoaL-like polyketide cyclase n=1 Tax=Roseovarius albus TaxID=1247867 RepID=A0A1X6YQE2_9RHOB|nr:SnoaL-like polyketide cyclase [Roseovarius albus]